MLREHPQYLLGMKVRASDYVVGSNAIRPVQRCIEALDEAGTGGRIMCHIGAVPGELEALFKLMRPGDIITHVYSGAGNNVVQNGKLLPIVREAQQRGVIMDVGHGATAFDFTIAEQALSQGLMPDTISSDLHIPGITGPGRAFLPWVMSKFLCLGLSLDDVVRLTTVAPAQIIGKVDKLGTLQVGAPADVTVMNMIERPVTFVDTKSNVRHGDRFLQPQRTFRASKPCVDRSSATYPYPSSSITPHSR